MGPIMRLNGILYKHLMAPTSKSTEKVKVHLGPGRKKYIKGWINVDANVFTGKADVWADLKNSLPFRDNSVDVFYSHHVIEHLPDLSFHFREMYRCLKPGAIIRVGGPNGDMAIKKFIENDKLWFIDFPEKRESIGGRFENFIFCKQEHLTILTFSYLEELAKNAGFKQIIKVLPKKETNFPYLIGKQLFDMEEDEDYNFPKTLLIEAKKEIND